MAISAVTISASQMSWAAPSAPHHLASGWTAPAVQTTAPALPSATPGAGDALAQGFRDAAKKAFMLGLNIALTSADRESSARAYLRSTQGASSADLQNDPMLGALENLAKSIIASTKHHGAAFVSILG